MGDTAGHSGGQDMYLFIYKDDIKAHAKTVRPGISGDASVRSSLTELERRISDFKT